MHIVKINGQTKFFNTKNEIAELIGITMIHFEQELKKNKSIQDIVDQSLKGKSTIELEKIITPKLFSSKRVKEKENEPETKVNKKIAKKQDPPKKVKSSKPRSKEKLIVEINGVKTEFKSYQAIIDHYSIPVYSSAINKMAKKKGISETVKYYINKYNLD